MLIYKNKKNKINAIMYKFYSYSPYYIKIEVIYKLKMIKLN